MKSQERGGFKKNTEAVIGYYLHAGRGASMKTSSLIGCNSDCPTATPRADMCHNNNST